jgi:hypothetical protein
MNRFAVGKILLICAALLAAAGGGRPAKGRSHSGQIHRGDGRQGRLPEKSQLHDDRYDGAGRDGAEGEGHNLPS